MRSCSWRSWWETSGPKVGPDQSANVLAGATQKFASNLTIGRHRKSAVVRVSFKHPNATTAAEVLRVFEAHYFALRAKLFDDLQASIVEAQENGVADQLAGADRVLATFKREQTSPISANGRRSCSPSRAG